MCGRLICLVSLTFALGLVFAGASNAADPGLVGCWKFDESSGTTAYDSSGNGNDGTLVLADSAISSAWVSGKYGSALSFDGVDDYVALTEQPPITNGFTFSAWVKKNGDSPSTQEIFNNHRFFLRTMPEGENSDNPFEAFVNLADGSVEPRAQSNVASTIGQWFFVAVTWDKTTLSIYVNGELEGTSIRSGELTSTTVEARIGRGEQTNLDVNPFNGLIDEVALFDVALEAKDIEAIMNNGLAGIIPGQPFAIGSSPGNEATDVLRDADLSWSAGVYAATHDLYVGESFEEVDAATVPTALGLDVTSFDPGRLELGQTYFWRVDEVNAAPDNTVFKGEVWSFTVEPFAYAIGNIVATSNGIFEPGNGPENTVNGSGLNEDDQHSMQAGDMWLANPDGETPLSIQYEFDRVYKLHQMLVWNYNVQFELMLGFGIKDASVEYSTDGIDWMALTDAVLAQATATGTYTANTVVDFAGVAAQYVRLTVNSGWGVLGQFGLSEVRFLQIPAFAREPQPASGTTDMAPEAVLSWRSGREAVSHEVYVATDEQAVIDGIASMATVSEPSYDAILDLNQTYYWKVVEVNDVEDPAVWEGDIWSFSVAESVVVEDFESYNDDNNPIYDAWLDGWVNETGSTVGYLSTPFAETILAHSGVQSMPLSYDNTGGVTVSEAERILDASQDWTKHTVKSLSLSFFGDPGNSGGQLYIMINGTKVLYEGSAEDLKIAAWMPWIIDLAGLNVQNVTTLTIGIEGAGATGMVLIDDIRLYPYDGELVTAVAPDDAGLVAYYPLDGDASDAVGGHDGTISGTPDFVAGYDGQAIDLASNATVAQYITVAYAEDLALNSFTAAAWVNVKDLDALRGILGTRFNSDNTFDFKVSSTFVHGDIGDGSAWLNTALDIDAAHGGVISVDTWHHIAYAIDAAAGTAEVYLDGVLGATLNFTGTPLLMKSDQELRIGNCSGVEYMNGMIDEVRIYNRALSAAEVAGLVGRTGSFYKPL
jgi:concanavalin A-like lectin/glucanase superfamily protein